jgi:hypothetical protein
LLRVLLITKGGRRKVTIMSLTLKAYASSTFYSLFYVGFNFLKTIPSQQYRRRYQNGLRRHEHPHSPELENTAPHGAHS